MYKRIVLKLSGEALAGEKKGVTFDDSIIWGLIAQIKAVMAKGTQVSLVIGGGNFWRKGYLAFLKKTVILPHGKGAVPI